MTEEDIFAEAIKRRDRADRAAYVAHACGGDEAGLRRAVELLLHAHDRGAGVAVGALREAGAARVFTPKDFALTGIVDDLVTVIRQANDLP